MSKIFFVTSNDYKAQELRLLGELHDIEVVPVTRKINELQTVDTEALVRDKTIQAFRTIRLPVIVDHAGLYIDCLNGMPGGLTQIVWDSLEDRLCQIVASLGDDAANARSTLGYCDGREIRLFAGRKAGVIAPAARGHRHFQWDTIFMPEGESRTYAEMEITEKNEISQRRIAFDDFAATLVN